MPRRSMRTQLLILDRYPVNQCPPRHGRSDLRPPSISHAIAIASVACIAGVAGLGGMMAASAAQPTVGLGTAGSFAVLAGTTATNTGPTTISGSLGVSPGTAITGFPPGHVSNGIKHSADAVALQAKADLTAAYLDAAGRTPFTVTGKQLGGKTLAPGVYRGSSELALTGTVTLDAHGDAGSIFIFQAGSTLITASNSVVRLTNGAQACNVFWQVGSSATLGTNSRFTGTILALTSATLNTGASVTGRILARNGAVTMDSNVISETACTTTTPPPTPTTTPTSTPTTVPVTPTTHPGGGTTTHPKGTTPPPVRNTTAHGIVPKGSPHTGEGGTSRSPDSRLFVASGTALLGAAVAASLAVKRRRPMTRIAPDDHVGG